MSYSSSRIYLIGFMGSGKSFVGNCLAKKLGWPFMDIDDLIELKSQMSVADIFAHQGERAFRKIEQECLHESQLYDKLIVACGGGTPCFLGNMDWINAHGISIYLRTSVDLLYQRLEEETQHRPLLLGKKEDQLKTYIRGKLAERKNCYEKADLSFDQSPDVDTAAQLAVLLNHITGH